MKTVEQLEKLSKNPFYVMSEEEALALEGAQKATSASEDNKKKESYSLGNATVKETGKFDKYHGDPVKE